MEKVEKIIFSNKYIFPNYELNNQVKLLEIMRNQDIPYLDESDINIVLNHISNKNGSEKTSCLFISNTDILK